MRGLVCHAVCCDTAHVVSGEHSVFFNPMTKSVRDTSTRLYVSKSIDASVARCVRSDLPDNMHLVVGYT